MLHKVRDNMSTATILFYGQKSAGKGFLLRANDSGNLEANSYGSTAKLDSNTKIRDGNWHHVAFTYNGNGTARLYIDGQETGQATNWTMDTQSELQPGTYRCIISNTSGSVTSNGAVLTVN